jgi:hypothetical protein
VGLAVVISAIYLSIGGTPQKAQEQEGSGSTFERFSTGDNVTSVIRDRSKVLARVATGSASEKEQAAKYGTIVHDYGSFVILAKKKGTNIPASRLVSQPMETSLHLPGGKFEPLDQARPEAVRPGVEAPKGKGYYIVQFGASVTDEWLQSLTDAGAEILQYVPHQAFFVYADGEAITRIAGHSRVRWVGAFTPEEKLSGVLIDQLSAARDKTALRSTNSPLELTKENKAIFDVAVFARADINEIGQRVATQTSGTIQNVIKLPNNFFNVVRIEMPLDQVERAAEIPDVIRIDSWGRPRVEDERAAMIVAGNYTGPTTISAPGYNPLTQFGVDGTGATISMVDDGVSIPGNGGFYVTSTNTVDGPLRGSTSGASGGHGHINASIISGNAPFGILDPLSYNYGLGVAPKSNIINVPMLKAGYSGTEANAYGDTVITAGPNGVLGTISNNSWGNGTNSNVYDSYTAQFDGYARDASTAASIDPILLVFSAGNSGPGALSLTRPKAAKNLIATGNSENLRTELSASANNMEDLTSSSSRGPAADGRVKPDITAPGTVITGSRAGSCGSVSSCFDANHAWSTGTSHAAPQIAGVAALFTQWWKNNNSNIAPSPALTKASVILTAQEMTGVNVAAVVPNGAEGWGRVNMKYMLNPGVPIKRVNQTIAFSNPGESTTLSGVVADTSKPVRVTLVWTDPPATADPALINNLDLSVTIGGTLYRGNVFSGGLSTTGGSADTLNNVENVFRASGTTAGTPVSVTVSATALNGDGILGNADATDQHFALVIHNFNSSKPSDFDGDGKSDIGVWRNADGNWYATRSSDSVFIGFPFGTNGDMIAPGDYDGDGKTDFAVFRPSDGTWYIQRSTLGFTAQAFGTNGDLPSQGDFDGDGKTDISVFRPSNGTWYQLRSTTGFFAQAFGTNGDRPVAGDYDGDGKTDIAVFRPSNGTWYQFRSSTGFFGQAFGLGSDRVMPGDYDGDGLHDLAVFRPADGNWYILRSTTGFLAQAFGSVNDIPSAGDFDGDGKSDISVFRPSEGNWYQLRSNTGFFAVHFGSNGDKPVPAGYVPVQ